MVSHKELTAWITVNGEVLKEYEAEPESEERKMTCWIASEPGKHFQIHWRDSGSKVTTASYCVLDGHTTPGRFLYGYGQTMRSGARAGPNSERPFMFSNIPDNARTHPRSMNEENFGTIQLQIAQVQRGPNRAPTPLQILPPTIPKDHASLTGGHCATYSKEEVPYYAQFPGTWTSKPLDENNPHSYVKFTWKYRPIEYLKEHDIVKRPLPSIDTTPLPPLPSPMNPGQAQAPPSKPKAKRSKRTRLPKPPLVGSQHAGPDGTTSAFALGPPAGSYNFLTPTAAPPQSLTSTQHPLFKIPVGRAPSSAPNHAMDEDEGSRSARLPFSSQARNEQDNGKGKGRMTRTGSSGSATSSAVESASVTGGVRVPAVQTTTTTISGAGAGGSIPGSSQDGSISSRNMQVAAALSHSPAPSTSTTGSSSLSMPSTSSLVLPKAPTTRIAIRQSSPGPSNMLAIGLHMPDDEYSLFPGYDFMVPPEMYDFINFDAMDED